MMLADLPPSSRATRFTVAAATSLTRVPARVEPVKLTMSTSGCSASGAPTAGPVPSRMSIGEFGRARFGQPLFTPDGLWLDVAANLAFGIHLPFHSTFLMLGFLTVGVAVPTPGMVEYQGQRLPASYANFYIANGVVIVPTFNDPNDRIALGILGELFRDRPVVGIHAVDLVLGFGSLHCLTQQEPA